MNKMKRILILPIIFFSFLLFSKNIEAASCTSGSLTFLFQNEKLKIADVNGVLKMCGASDGENCYEFVSAQTKIEAAIENQNCSQIVVKTEKDTNYGEKIKYIISFEKMDSGGSQGGQTVSCGNIEGIPDRIPQITSTIVTFIQILVPIFLVVFGMLDFVKAVVAQKDDEIKKGQKMFLKRLLVGAFVFFILVIVKLVISLVAGSDASGIIECMDCFLSNNC